MVFAYRNKNKHRNLDIKITVLICLSTRALIQLNEYSKGVQIGMKFQLLADFLNFCTAHVSAVGEHESP